MDEGLNFRIENAKKEQCSSLKVATCENFQRWKMLLHRRGVLVGNSCSNNIVR